MNYKLLVLSVIFSTNVQASVLCSGEGSAFSPAGAKLQAYSNIDRSCLMGYLEAKCEPTSECSKKARYKFEAKEIGGNCFRDPEGAKTTCYMDYLVTCETYKAGAKNGQ